MATDGRHVMHWGIAEQGKLHALAGRYHDALMHYREALRLAVGARAPEVVFRHYTQCVMEALEAMGAHDEVIQWCRQALDHYAQLGVSGGIYDRDRAAIQERLALQHLKREEPEQAREHLAEAVTLGGRQGAPLAAELLGWLERGYAIEARRLQEAQRRHRYYTVRADQVDASRAIPLPETLKQRSAGHPGLT